MSALFKNSKKLSYEQVIELKNGFAMIIGNCETLKRDINLIPDQRQKLTRIQDRVCKIVKLLGLHERR